MINNTVNDNDYNNRTFICGSPVANSMYHNFVLEYTITRNGRSYIANVLWC